MDDKQWVGSFFTPTVGKRYMVPIDSANYTDLRGAEGECIDYDQNAYGHSWAHIRFDNSGVRLVRTSYLAPVEGERESLAETFDDALMSVAEMQRYALHVKSAGTVVLKTMGPPPE